MVNSSKLQFEYGQEKEHVDRISREEAGDKFNLTSLPETAREEIRIINIGDYDSCLCSGLHVSNTSEIKDLS